MPSKLTGSVVSTSDIAADRETRLSSCRATTSREWILTFLAFVANETSCAPTPVLIQLGNAHATVKARAVVARRTFKL